MIFDFIGTPSEHDLELIEKEDAKKYIRCFDKRQSVDLSRAFPGSSKVALDLLARMLIFTPSKRITVAEALEHSFFADIEDKSVHLHRDGPVFLPFELEHELDEERLRKYYLLEIQRYHPDVQLPTKFENL